MRNEKQKDAHKRTGEGVARAARERKDAAESLALIAVAKDRALTHRGKDKVITPEMQEEALDLLACGMPMDRVCEHFELNRSAFLVRGQYDTEFDRRLKMAMALGTVEIVNSTFRVVDQEPGYTTGSIERDKLKVDNAWRYAKTIGNKIFGDKLQVDQRSITITVNRDEGDW